MIRSTDILTSNIKNMPKLLLKKEYLRNEKMAIMFQKKLERVQNRKELLSNELNSRCTDITVYKPFRANSKRSDESLNFWINLYKRGISKYNYDLREAKKSIELCKVGLYELEREKHHRLIDEQIRSNEKSKISSSDFHTNYEIEMKKRKMDFLAESQEPKSSKNTKAGNFDHFLYFVKNIIILTSLAVIYKTGQQLSTVHSHVNSDRAEKFSTNTNQTNGR